MLVEKCLTALRNQKKSVPVKTLINLSDLSSAEVKLFKETWKEIEVERRREVIGELIALARGNATLNFDRVFLSCFSDSDAQVRTKAIEGLWECEDCSIIPALIERLMTDKEDAVRTAAASALGRFALLGELRKVHSRHIAKIGDLLFKIIDAKGEDVELRGRAMEAIASVNLTGVKKLIYKAYHGEDPALRASALRAMGLNCDPVWLPILIKELGNPDPEMCLEAVKACGELGEEEVVPHLLRLIREADITIKLAALTALKQIGGGGAKQALYECLNYQDEQVRQMAKEAWEGVET